MACSKGRKEVVEFLLPLAGSSDNFPAFFAACESGRADTASLLIKQATVDTFCRVVEEGHYAGETCLMAACRHGHLDVIVLILDRMEEEKVISQFYWSRGCNMNMCVFADQACCSGARFYVQNR